jgi:ribonuclease P protein component
VLPRAHRLRRSVDFGRAVRLGRRFAAPSLVVHVLSGEDAAAVRVGFVVSRAVGGAVVRNRVKRRLRHLVAERLDLVPQGVSIVVRATPPAATSDYTILGHDLDRCLRRMAQDRRSR